MDGVSKGLERKAWEWMSGRVGRVRYVRRVLMTVEWCRVVVVCAFCLFFQAEDGIRDRSPSRGLGDVYKRQDYWGITSHTGSISEQLFPDKNA